MAARICTSIDLFIYTMPILESISRYTDWSKSVADDGMIHSLLQWCSFVGTNYQGLWPMNYHVTDLIVCDKKTFTILISLH